jgi:hypothetical protein
LKISGGGVNALKITPSARLKMRVKGIKKQGWFSVLCGVLFGISCLLFLWVQKYDFFWDLKKYFF